VTRRADATASRETSRHKRPGHLQIVIGILKALFTTSPLKTSELVIDEGGRVVVVTHERRRARGNRSRSSLD